MKQFSLDEYLKNPSRKVVTRGGYPVRIICTDAHYKNCPIIALVSREDGTEDVFLYTKQGTFFNSEPDEFDLLFTPEKHEGWFNIYHCDDLGFYIRQNQPYKSKEEADEIAKANFRTFFATVKVEWEE